MRDIGFALTQKSELPEIYAIQCRAFATELHEPLELFEDMLRHYPQGCFSIFEGDRIVGYVFAHPSDDDRDDYESAGWHVRGDEKCLFIHDLCIDPAFHGRGIAQKAAAHIEGFARVQAFQSIIGTAIEGVEKFWEKQGFTMLRPYDYSGEKATFMEKKLI